MRLASFRHRRGPYPAARQYLMSLSRSQLMTISTALFNHQRTCDLKADELMDARSSDASYEHNVNMSHQARSYRWFAAECRAVLKDVNAMLACDEDA